MLEVSMSPSRTSAPQKLARASDLRRSLVYQETESKDPKASKTKKQTSFGMF